MIRPTSILSRFVSVLCTTLLVNLAMPMTAGKWLGENWPEIIRYKHRTQAQGTRPLSAKEMKQMLGKWAKNPYAAGSQKWSVNYKGVDLVTGNFSLSNTDMSFEGGYGIPVNVTRSYSANEGDEGPFGVGWSISVDVRSTAGGILKSPAAPIRDVPVSFKERPSAQLNDPNAELVNGTSGSAVQPASAVLATDAAGTEETDQRDVDGVITTPPWDKNTDDATYEWVTFGGSQYQVLTHNVTTTPDGTVYVYDKQGDYGTGGVSSFDGSGSAEPSNVLKITSATDRQGNETDYHYGSGTVSFYKANGATTEHPLSYITMPNGHQINFHWGSGGTANRITSIDDNVSGGRTIAYTYDSSGNLATVTSAAGLTTTYGYGAATASASSYPYAGADNMITSITDPRGLVTNIYYTVDTSYMAPYMVEMGTVKVWKLVAPNGVSTYYRSNSGDVPSSSYYHPKPTYAIASGEYADIAYGDTTPFQTGAIWETLIGSPSVFVVSHDTPAGIPAGGSPDYTLSGSPKQQIYDPTSENLIADDSYNTPINNTLASDRNMTSSSPSTSVGTLYSYNFMGNKLSETVKERSGSTATLTRQQTTDYSYWGADKYFQQKATRIQTGSSTYRYTYTDYFDSSAAAGARGQTKSVYSPAFTTFDVSSTGQPTPPTGTDSGDYWKYYLRIASGYTDTPAAKFYDGSGTPAYDSQGRVTDVWKLQSTSTTPWTYVQTHTTYNDASGHWGQPETVVEDYGTGKINRTTTTNGYTNWGAADDVTDAAGHRFVTSFDGDGKVNSVTRTDVTPNVPIVTYTYGAPAYPATTSIDNGQPVEVIDGLSLVDQVITYDSTVHDGGLGQVATVLDKDSSSLYYESDYSYNGAGDRLTTTYKKGNSSSMAETARWGFTDYTSVGYAGCQSRPFQTLVTLDTSNNPTNEEFHYAYDLVGHLVVASFAQTPASGYTPSTGASYYNAGHQPSSRARAFYVYDPGGRMTQLNYWWDTWNTGSSAYNTPEAILSNACTYELSTGTSNLNRGLKTASDFYVQNPSDHAAFSLDHEEQYGYDSNRDYLTSASYDGGSTTTSWSYDAAGNRNDASVVDNLNRATTISSVSRTYDILGNTTAIGSTRAMGWDVLSRMTSFTLSSAATSYAYRADGMRVSKAAGTQTVTYGYDGQVGIEECLTDTGTSTNNYTTRYGLGARGIDRIETTNSSGTSVGYPVYDAHGNMMATVAKSGASYSIGNLRGYDAWGGVLSGSTTGSPSPRHCANLGHVQDDESSFVYMRARYYEPGSGRFISEDQDLEGINFFVYCDNSPVSKVDQTGKAGVEAKELEEIILKLCKQFGFAASIFYKMAKVQAILFALFATIVKCAAGIKAGKDNILYGEFLNELGQEELGDTFVAKGVVSVIINSAFAIIASYLAGMEIAAIVYGDGGGD